MSDPKASNPSHPDGGETKGHSPVVRIVEWVVIGALGLLVANEAYSKFSYDTTFANLEKAIDDAEAAGNTLRADEVAPLISGMPSRKESVSGRKTLIDYQWRSLFKTYRIVVHTAPAPGEDQMVVLSFETDAPPEDAKPAVVDGGNVETPGPGAPAGGPAPGPSGPPAGFTTPQMHGGGAGGGGGQRPPLEFSALDADGDGQLVVEDLPERMQERFGDIDTDGNGTISEEEFDARPRPGADQPAATDRPELETEEEDDQAEESDDEADSDEASEETDETTEEAAETGEETDEATEETDPSA